MSGLFVSLLFATHFHPLWGSENLLELVLLQITWTHMVRCMLETYPPTCILSHFFYACFAPRSLSSHGHHLLWFPHFLHGNCLLPHITQPFTLSLAFFSCFSFAAFSNCISFPHMNPCPHLELIKTYFGAGYMCVNTVGTVLDNSNRNRVYWLQLIFYHYVFIVLCKV